MLVATLLLCAGLFLWSKLHISRGIHSKVESIGGKVVAIRRDGRIDSPFRDDTRIILGNIYLVEYEMQGQRREGWVMLNGIRHKTFEWRL
ncbi:MAG: hypothetical protein FWE06_07235 [Oscillospiraceae bacterium]|nr:hypothetical protein [Oscillospiraceae bacterium]